MSRPIGPVRAARDVPDAGRLAGRLHLVAGAVVEDGGVVPEGSIVGAGATITAGAALEPGARIQPEETV